MTELDTARAFSIYPENEKANISAASTPFAIDQARLTDLYPAITDAVDLFISLNEDVSSGWSELALGDIKMSDIENRHMRRMTKDSFADATINLIISGGQYISAAQDWMSAEEHVAKILSAKFEGPMAEQVHNEFTTSIAEKAQLISDIKLKSIEVSHDVEASCIDADTDYALLKTLAARHDNETMTEYPLLPSDVLGDLIVIAGSDLYQNLKIRLRNGSFDRHIARDVLIFVEDNQHLSNGLAKIQQHLRFFSVALGESGDSDQVRERMLNALADWPIEQKRALLSARQGLETNFDESYLRARRSALDTVGHNPEGMQANFERNVEIFLAEIIRYIPRNTYSKVEIMRARAAVKLSHKRPKISEERVLPQEEPYETLEVPRELCHLVRFHGDTGDIEEFADDGSAGLKESYMKRFNDALLAKDVDKILSHMRNNLDFSKGRVPGIKKLTDAPIKVQGNAYDLWEFKNRDGVGVSTASKRAKTLRVLFVMLKHQTLGLVSIIDKDQENDILRGFGIGAKGRK